MLDIDQFEYHPTAEKIVDAIVEQANTRERHFFRLNVSHTMAMMASMMRTDFQMPGKSPRSACMFAINLAPSGFGKGLCESVINEQVTNLFMESFTQSTYPMMMEKNIPQIALRQAAANGTEPENEIKVLEGTVKRAGPYASVFSSATVPSIKQLRESLLIAKGGALNLQVDEIAFHIGSIREAMAAYLELYDGTIKPSLTKHTETQLRSAELRGSTPANLLFYGAPSLLLNGSKTEEEFKGMMDTGYARRCFFGFVTEAQANDIIILTAKEHVDRDLAGNSVAVLQKISNDFGKLANFINAHRVITVERPCAELYYEYRNYLIEQKRKLPAHEELQAREMQFRFDKAMKLAAAYAFIDRSAEVTVEHLQAAIKLAEDSGEKFRQIVTRELPFIRLAKYLGSCDTEVTQADLQEHCPYYRGVKSSKDEMLSNAIAWGYQHNIIIKKRYSDGIEFYRGETLKPTDLNAVRVAYSDDISYNYVNEAPAFDQLHCLTQAPDMHWCAHHTAHGHRCTEDIVPGCNLIVIDTDESVSLSMAKHILKGYKALYYTTKRHTPQNNRYRIIIPTNYELALDEEDYRQLMQNIFDVLPFDVDENTKERSRKWASCDIGTYEYTEGATLDVLPFIPKTKRAEETRRAINNLQNLDKLERWFVHNAYKDTNRNKMMIKYALMLVDGGWDGQSIQDAVFELNSKLEDPLDESEILSSTMVTVAKRVSERDAMLAANSVITP